MQMGKFPAEELKILLDRLFENLERKGMKFSAEEKEAIKNRVFAALEQAHPNGLTASDLRNDDFKKRLQLAFVAAAVMQKSPANLNLTFFIDKILKKDEPISDHELKHAFKKIFLELNKLTPKPLSEKKIDELVDSLMKSDKATPLELFDKLLEEKFALDQQLAQEANLYGGATHIPGVVLISQVQVLLGNLAGVALNAPAFQATGTLWDDVLPGPNERPDVEKAIHNRQAGLGLVDAIEEETAKFALNPRNMPHG